MFWPLLARADTEEELSLNNKFHFCLTGGGLGGGGGGWGFTVRGVRFAVVGLGAVMFGYGFHFLLGFGNLNS